MCVCVLLACGMIHFTYCTHEKNWDPPASFLLLLLFVICLVGSSIVSFLSLFVVVINFCSVTIFFRYQYRFFVQVFGGPDLYLQKKGGKYTRLVGRHANYKISASAADRWIHHMILAINEHSRLQLPPSPSTSSSRSTKMTTKEDHHHQQQQQHDGHGSGGGGGGNSFGGGGIDYTVAPEAAEETALVIEEAKDALIKYFKYTAHYIVASMSYMRDDQVRLLTLQGFKKENELCMFLFCCCWCCSSSSSGLLLGVRIATYYYESLRSYIDPFFYLLTLPRSLPHFTFTLTHSIMYECMFSFVDSTQLSGGTSIDVGRVW